MVIRAIYTYARPRGLNIAEFWQITGTRILVETVQVSGFSARDSREGVLRVTHRLPHIGVVQFPTLALRGKSVENRIGVVFLFHMGELNRSQGPLSSRPREVPQSQYARFGFVSEGKGKTSDR